MALEGNSTGGIFAYRFGIYGASESARGYGGDSGP